MTSRVLYFGIHFVIDSFGFCHDKLSNGVLKKFKDASI